MRIVGLGDSLTWGYPDGPEYSWLYVLGKKMSCEVINRGTNGAVLSYMRTRVPQVIADQPDMVIIMGSTNDAFDKLSVERVSNEFRAIFDELTEKTSARIVIGLPIPLNYQIEESYLSQYRDWMKKFAEEKQCAVIDFYTALVDSQTGGIQAKYNLDDLHPNILGYEQMAEEAYKIVKGLS